MTKIYTRTGDDGSTGLISGNRVGKNDVRINLYGEVDELNSFIGFHLSCLTSFPNETLLLDQIELLKKIQSNLFNLGSQLACEAKNRSKYKLPPVNVKLIDALESSIDVMESQLQSLQNFILPGGSQASASAHLCRAVSRRVERSLVQFNQNQEPAPEGSLQFINRISDYFFVLARYLNKLQKVPDVLWDKK